MKNRYEQWVCGLKVLISFEKIMSQKELARHTEMHPVTINQILTGKKKAGETAQERISEATGYSYDQIREIGREEENSLQRAGTYSSINRAGRVRMHDRNEWIIAAIRYLADKNGVSNKDIAEAVGVSYRTISYILSRQRGVSMKIAHNIAEYFGTTLPVMLSAGEAMIERGVSGTEFFGGEKITERKMNEDEGDLRKIIELQQRIITMQQERLKTEEKIKALQRELEKKEEKIKAMAEDKEVLRDIPCGEQTGDAIASGPLGVARLSLLSEADKDRGCGCRPLL